MKIASASPHDFGHRGIFTSFLILTVSVGISEANGVKVGEAESEAIGVWPGLYTEEGMFDGNTSSQLKYPLPARLKRETEVVTKPDLKTQLDQFKDQLNPEFVETLTETISELNGLYGEVEILRKRVRVQRKEIEKKTNLIDKQNKDIKRLKEAEEVFTQEISEKDKELAWLKSKFLNNSDWNTELHLAVRRRDEDAVKKLVEDGAYIDVRNKDLRTPLIVTRTGSRSVRIIKYLIEHGADVCAKDVFHGTFLHVLLWSPYPITPSQFHDIAELVVSQNKSSLFSRTGTGYSINPLLHLALYKLEVENRTLSLLYRNGVNLLSVTDRDGCSILYPALTGKRSTKLLSDLVALGVNWRHLNKFKTSLVHHAAMCGYIDGLKYFLSLGLPINALDIDNATPLHYAITSSSINVLETVQLLIDNGANVSITNRFGQTPLEKALERNNMIDQEKVVQLLLSSG